MLPGLLAAPSAQRLARIAIGVLLAATLGLHTLHAATSAWRTRTTLETRSQAIVELGFEGYVAQEFIPKRDPMTSLRQGKEICDV